MGDALTDSLPRYDPKSQELAYNNTTDRMRIELPEYNDPASSGCVTVVGYGGATTLPVELAVHLSQSTDNVRIYSASGTTSIPVYTSDEPIDVLEKNPAQLRRMSHTFAQLTAPGKTDPIYVSPYSKHLFQYTINAINTSVQLGASGSLDGSNWFNLDANDSSVTNTASGTYAMQFDGLIDYALFSFLKEVGGTTATVDVKYLGGN